MDFRERRQESRKTALMHAFVSDRSDSIDLKCVIREISKGGCRITSSYIEDLPRVIDILPEGFEAPITGKIIWRNGKFAGVQFISEAEAIELDRAQPERARPPEPSGFFARMQSMVSLRRRAGLFTAEKPSAGGEAPATFTANVLRVLTNPLAALKGLLNLLMGSSDVELPQQAQSVLKAAHMNAENAERMVEEALQAENVESGHLPCEPEPTDIVALANNAMLASTGFAASNEIQMELKDDVGQATVAADARRLEEVIGHLLSHAAESSPRGEKVTLSLSRNADRIRLAVHDDGLGSTIGDAGGTATLDDVADQTSQWLRLCHAVLEKHGSRLQVDTRPGSGTTAWFELKESA